ncbi:MAG: hypothetical protein KME04_13615 [Pleurocapsa minor GSE-CHR-MK-17-07R]|nr:hypothetical protein [Pleurocapsa minor GSE-CHR-MK 17-07R]
MKSSRFTPTLSKFIAAASASLMIGTLALVASLADQPAEAQQPPGQNFCSDFILQALETLDDNCNAMDRNSACYGNFRVGATFLEEVEDGYFSRPADRADLVQLQSISTDPLDPDAEEWGIALINAQANLPGSLPGQAVTFLLMGDATVVNAVSPEQAALPFDPIEVTTSAQTAIRTQPEANANLAGSAPQGAVLGADATDGTGLWIRAFYQDPADAESPAVGGWVLRSSLVAFDASILPAVNAETRTPMQSFIFRTGLGRPVCDQAPNQVIVQGPTNTQVNLNVNGADIVVGSTVGLQSVQGAPQDILDELDLPDDIIEQLTQGGGGEATQEAGNGDPNSECAVMQLTVINGEVLLNEDELVLPEGNKAFAVSCGLPPTNDSSDPESTEEPGNLVEELLNQQFASEWGAPRPLTEEELNALLPLENLTTDNINYEIDIPDVNDVTPAFTNTPTFTPTFRPVTSTPTALPTGTPTGTPLPPATAVPPPANVGQPAQGTNVVGGGQVAIVGQPFPNPFSVTVLDPYGTPVVGTAVTFTAPTGGATGTFAATGTNSQTVVTNGSGTATTSSFTPNTVSGQYAVIATAPSTVASAPSADTLAKRPSFQTRVVATFSVANAAGEAMGIEVISGSGQSVGIGENYPNPLVARVVDEFGNGVAGVNVTFLIDYYAPILFDPENSEVDIVTDANGYATTPLLYNYSQSGGQYTVYAYPSGLEDSAFFNLNIIEPPTATFTPTLIPTATLTPVPGVGSGSVTSGDGQALTINQTGSGITIQILDTNSQPMDGVSIVMSISGAEFLVGQGGSPTWSGTTSGGGFATSDPVQATCAAGSYNVGITANGLSVSGASGTVSPGAVESIQVTSGDNQSIGPGQPFPTELRARVTDSCNNPVPGVSISFTGPALSGAAIDFGGSNVASGSSDGSGEFGAFGTATNIDGTFQVTASANGGNPSSVLFLTIQSLALNVTSLADSGPGTLRDIMAAAPPDSTITFGVTGTIAVSSPLSIEKNVSFDGPGAGSLTISGGGGTRVFINNGYTVSMDGLTISNGSAGDGAGVYNAGGMTLTDMVFSGNAVSLTGGAIYNSGSLTVSNSTFSGNSAGVDGSAIHSNTNATILIATSTFTGNTGQAVSLLNGGTISSSSFISNTGRAVGISGAPAVTLLGVTFQGNSASPWDGGAVYIGAGSTANVTNSIFLNNFTNVTSETCCAKGGAIFVEGTLTATGTEFVGNTAGSSAGAVQGWINATINITNSCITGNSDGSNVAISSASSTTANLQFNWWGDPGGAGANGVNGASGNVNTASPLASAPVTC